MFLFSRILMGRGAARAGKVPAPAPAPAAQSAGIELSNAPETLSLFGQHVIDSEVEQLYTTWCITRTLPPAYNPNRPAGDLGVAVALARDVLTSKAAEAWVLAHQRGDGGFERYALAWLIQNCGFAFFGPWESIEARCPDLSSIRRFANHWVAWNESLNLSRSGPIAGTQSEFTGLYAATLVNQVVNGRTHDPRMFDLEHWFNTCGDDLTPTCDHNPVVRRVRQWENSRPQVPVVPQVGRGDEIYRQTQATVPGGSSSLGRIVLRMLADLNIRIPPPGKMRRGRIVSVVLFLLSLSLTLFLASFQIGGVIQPLPGVRISNVNFIFAVIILGVVYIFSEASAQGRRAKRICVLLCVLFNIFTFSNGAAWAVDTDSCIQLQDVDTCAPVRASSVFVWLCIPFSVLYLIAMRLRM